MMNYDPNLAGCRIARQTVRLTFGTWDYRAEKEVVVYGNVLGLSVIDTAVLGAYESLRVGKHGKEIRLKNDAGKELLCCDDEDEDWLKKMVVKAEIVAIEEGKNC